MATALLSGRQPEMRMVETSQESSLDTTNTSQELDHEPPSDDDDDELLALRIAALESIKIKEAKAAKEARKPEFLIQSHPARGNLVSIVTCEAEITASRAPAPALPPLPPRISPPRAPPALVPVFDRTRPPPGCYPTPLTSDPLLPFPPPRRYSRSPRRWSRSPPPRRSASPPYRRRRSPSPRRYRSPSPRARRSPGSPRRRSPPRRSAPRSPPRPRSPSLSEWESDTEEELEQEAAKDQKENVAPTVANSDTKVEKVVKGEVEEEDSVEDFLKLDATAEVDEFSQFLNEFEDEVLDEKKKAEAAAAEASKKKKDRPVTEKKVVEGKKLRKKVKAARVSPPPRRSPDRRSAPRGGERREGLGERREAGARYFSPARRGSGSPSRRRLAPPRSMSPDSKGRPSPGRRSQESRSSKAKEKGPAEKPKETAEERKEREEREYSAKLAALPSPEREVLEARRRKFEGRAAGAVADARTKISLKTSSSVPSLAAEQARKRRAGSREEEPVSSRTGRSREEEPTFDTGPRAVSAALKKLESAPRRKEEPEGEGRKAGGRREDQDGEGRKTGGRREEPEGDVRAGGAVTDLRVRLHKKKQEAAGKIEPAKRSPGEERGEQLLKKPISVRLKLPEAVEKSSDERSPSPPPQKRSRKKREEVEEQEDGLAGRRIIMARPRSLSQEDSSPEAARMEVATVAEPRRGMKKSLSSRLGPPGAGVMVENSQKFTEKEIYEEMLRQQESRRIANEEKEIRKLKKAMRKKEKLEKKLKKHKKENKKSRKAAANDDSDFSESEMLASLDLLKAKQEQLASAPASADVDSDEELYRFFEEPEEGARKEKKSSSAAKKRRSSGEASGGERKRRSSGEAGLRARLGRRVEGEGGKVGRRSKN